MRRRKRRRRGGDGGRRAGSNASNDAKNDAKEKNEAEKSEEKQEFFLPECLKEIDMSKFFLNPALVLDNDPNHIPFSRLAFPVLYFSLNLAAKNNGVGLPT